MIERILQADRKDNHGHLKTWAVMTDSGLLVRATPNGGYSLRLEVQMTAKELAVEKERAKAVAGTMCSPNPRWQDYARTWRSLGEFGELNQQGKLIPLPIPIIVDGEEYRYLRGGNFGGSTGNCCWAVLSPTEEAGHEKALVLGEWNH